MSVVRPDCIVWTGMLRFGWPGPIYGLTEPTRYVWRRWRESNPHAALAADRVQIGARHQSGGTSSTAIVAARQSWVTGSGCSGRDIRVSPGHDRAHLSSGSPVLFPVAVTLYGPDGV